MGLTTASSFQPVLADPLAVSSLGRENGPVESVFW